MVTRVFHETGETTLADIRSVVIEELVRQPKEASLTGHPMGSKRCLCNESGESECHLSELSAKPRAGNPEELFDARWTPKRLLSFGHTSHHHQAASAECTERW